MQLLLEGQSTEITATQTAWPVAIVMGSPRKRVIIYYMRHGQRYLASRTEWVKEPKRLYGIHGELRGSYVPVFYSIMKGY